MQLFDFFTGIGGFSLAAEWVGWEVVSQCEIDEYCQKQLKKIWPNVYLHEDIRTYTYETYQMARGSSQEETIFAGGFPCQPFSHAGKRKGTDDHRNLWPEYHRIIHKCKPTYVVGENVPGLVSMEDGKVLDGIFSDLENSGYEVEAYLIPACGVEAWHRRERLWVIGYLPEWFETNTPCSDTDSIRSHRPEKQQQGEAEFRDKQKCESEGLGESISHGVMGYTNSKRTSRDNRRKSQRIGMEVEQFSLDQTKQCESKHKLDASSEDVSDTTEQGLQNRGRTPMGESRTKSKSKRQNCNGGEWWSVEPNVGDLVDGLSPELAARVKRRLRRHGIDPRDRTIPRVAKGISDRVSRVKGLGNSIVPQVVFELFKAIEIHAITSKLT